VERRQFWAQFCDVPEVAVDTAAIVRDWQAAREAAAAALSAKLAAPLERATLPPPARAAITAYEARRAAVAALDEALKRANEAIQLVKEQAEEGDPAAIAADLLRLNAVRSRHTPAASPLCDAYLAERAAKVVTELQRDVAQAALERHRTTVFPGYQTAVNLYLQRFYAGFRLDSVTSTNTRGGPACSYNVLINNTRVAVAGGAPAVGEPSFRTALSAGDRNTLALAFFFASLDQRARLEDTVVVIDDPISSLDEHRELTTVQEVRRLAERTGQLIVLSHSKPFLCRIWEGADRAGRAALEVSRDGDGSTLRPWDVNQDSVTEHDRRHAALRQYLEASTPNNRDVAAALRPVLEAFVRVSYPEHFRPGATLGPFLTVCEQWAGKAREILDAGDKGELRDLLEYANRFHHDTNPAYETVRINDAELRGFVDRTLAFTRR
jgi:AAA domain-containing protein